MTKMDPDLPVTHLEQKRLRWATRFEITKRALIVFIAVLVTVILGVLVTLAQGNHKTLDAINSCTHPGRECYQHGQQQTAQAVASINKVVVLAAYCAARAPHQSITEIQRCVINHLADRKAPST